MRHMNVGYKRQSCNSPWVNPSSFSQWGELAFVQSTREAAFARTTGEPRCVQCALVGHIPPGRRKLTFVSEVAPWSPLELDEAYRLASRLVLVCSPYQRSLAVEPAALVTRGGPGRLNEDNEGRTAR
jgi:hypothetical protein